MAPSNTAARGIGGDTIHSSTGLWSDTRLTTDKLSGGRSPEMMDRWRPVQVLVLDEIVFSVKQDFDSHLPGSQDNYDLTLVLNLGV